MPLVFFLLVIIVLFVSITESGEKTKKRMELDKEFSVKTNARKERELVDHFIREGLSFNEAYDNAKREIEKEGFVPCIKKTDYAAFKEDCWSSNLTRDLKFFDSYYVTSLKDAARRAWWKSEYYLYTGNSLSEDAIDKVVYKNFPTTSYAYNIRYDEIKRNLKNNNLDF